MTVAMKGQVKLTYTSWPAVVVENGRSVHVPVATRLQSEAVDRLVPRLVVIPVTHTPSALKALRSPNAIPARGTTSSPAS